MMSLQKVFINFYLIAIPFYGLGQINLDRVIPKNVFSEIKTEQIMFNDKTYNSIFFSTVIPKKIIAKAFRSGLISMLQLRSVENDIGSIIEGTITGVKSYGFFVEISELNVEGLVHVSTLNNDWYEYRSRQNLLIGRKSKKSYKVGDQIEVRIIKVDILKYQIDLELK